jgi:hypothetical protein
MMILNKTLTFAICFVAIISLQNTFAQKQTQQQIDANGIKNIMIESNEVFRITLKSTKTPFITIKTASEGEYYQNISLNTELTGETLNVTSKYPQILTSGYDKLSAHKVLAMEVLLEVPENLSITLQSNVASVFGEGKFEYLQLELKSGQCVLKDFNGNLLVNTYKGNISVETSPSRVEAESRHGLIVNNLDYTGQQLIKLKTIDGNITITKSQ